MKENFFKVAAFYKFTPLHNLSELQETFMQFLTQHKIKSGNEKPKSREREIINIKNSSNN